MATRNICVFCASSMGARPEYGTVAQELARAIAHAGYGLVYGGAKVGLMGVVADAALAAGAEVIGVIPQVLVDLEVAHTGLTQLLLVDSMHERKAVMARHADAFIALPGGLGTLEEVFEVITWSQLRIHSKPCLLLNVAGYYDKLLAFLDHAVEEGTLKPQNRKIVMVAETAEGALAQIEIAWKLIAAEHAAENPAGITP